MKTTNVRRMVAIRPSIKTLMTIKDVTREDAIEIRRIMATTGRDGLGRTRLQQIDALLSTFGVEYVGKGRNAKSPAFYYCNTGDIYAETVVKIRGRFIVSSWGDIVERGNYD